jgi:hypothetical protein
LREAGSYIVVVPAVGEEVEPNKTTAKDIETLPNISLSDLHGKRCNATLPGANGYRMESMLASKNKLSPFHAQLHMQHASRI